MDRAQKAESIETLKGVFADAGAVVVTHNLGLTVADMEDLRGRLRTAGGTFKVVKNRLALKALDAAEGSEYHGLFKGPVGIAYADDAVMAAKITAEYAKANDKFIVLGGFMGDKVLDAAGVGVLSKLPSLDQIRASLLGLLNAPATKIAGVVQAPASQLARVFSAYAAKDAA
jgi:large subunit ribosomal protein L10